MNKQTNLFALVLLVAFGFLATPVLADINDLNVDDTFTYGTSQTITVKVTVKTPVPDITGLTFYSIGPDGLTELDSRIVDTTGRYTGTITIPANATNVVAKSRWLDSFIKLNLRINNQVATAIFTHE
jgi:hypothetical protein